jgi:hypothetical protein
MASSEETELDRFDRQWVNAPDLMTFMAKYMGAHPDEFVLD